MTSYLGRIVSRMERSAYMGGDLQESYNHEISLTYKNGKFVLLWWAYNIGDTDWVGLYNSKDSPDTDCISGAWQWASSGYSFETSVYIKPGMQARYLVKQGSVYVSVARTDPFPAICTSIKIDSSTADKKPRNIKRTEELPADFDLSQSPRQMAEYLRNLPGQEKAADWSAYDGTATLGYKEGKFIISWVMNRYDVYDWIGLYADSSASQNNYKTYQWLKAGSPYLTSYEVKPDYEIRYYTYSASSKDYVMVSTGESFKQIKVNSYDNRKFPTPAEGSRWISLKTLFPKLVQANTYITAGITYQYNCIAWSIGFNDRWINPDTTVADFVKSYLKAGCQEVGYGSYSMAICGWANKSDPTHGSRKYGGVSVGVSGLWESKLGANYRITHGCDELAGDSYGKIVKSFTAPQMFTLQKQETTFTSMDYMRLGCMLEETAGETCSGFEALFEKLRDTWLSDEMKYSSNTRDLMKTAPWQALYDMGTAILPLLVAKLMKEDNFFALPLYDELQPDSLLLTTCPAGTTDLSLLLEGEQARAKRTVKKYLEAAD